MNNRVNIINVVVERLLPNPWNPNVQTDFMFEKERESIRRHGMIDPITVRELDDGFFQIVDGEHRFKAAQLEGYTEISANNLGVLADEVAKQLTLVMNDIKGANDQTKLQQLLIDIESIIGKDEMIQVLPYEESKITEYLAQGSVKWNEVAPQQGNPDEQTQEENQQSKSVNQESPKSFNEHEPMSTSFTGSIFMRVPQEVSEKFYDQIQRFNEHLFPDTNPEEVDSSISLEQMIKVLEDFDISNIKTAD